MAKAKSATKTPEVKEVRIRPLRRETLKLTIVGLTPLLTSRFTPEAVDSIEEKRQRGATEQRGEKKKLPTPDEQYLGSRYMIDAKTHGFPIGGLKAAMVAAFRNIEGMSMEQAKPLFHSMPGPTHDELYPIKFKRVESKMHIARNDKTKARFPVYRAMYSDWTMDVILTWDATILTADEIVNLVNQAGTVGLGAFSPRCKGHYGQFEVQMDKGKAKKKKVA